MQIVWGNSFDGTNNYMSYEKKRAEKNGGTPNNPLIAENKLSAQEAEKRLREAEDKLLEEYRRQITEVEGSGHDEKTKRVMIEGITDKISQIEEARATREQEALIREQEKKANEAEKKKRTEESKNQEAFDEPEAAIKREDIDGMVKLSVSHESLREMSRTKAMLNSEAKQLEVDISNDFGTAKYGRFSSSHAMPNDFKHRQLHKLTKGIGSLDASIASEIRKLAENTEKTAERKAEEATEKKPETTETKIDEQEEK